MAAAPPSPRDRARELLARQFDRMGSAYRNTAGLIRTGWGNFWVEACIDAMVPLVLLCPDADAEDEG